MSKLLVEARVGTVAVGVVGLDWMIQIRFLFGG